MLAMSNYCAWMHPAKQNSMLTYHFYLQSYNTHKHTHTHLVSIKMSLRFTPSPSHTHTHTHTHIHTCTFTGKTYSVIPHVSKIYMVWYYGVVIFGTGKREFRQLLKIKTACSHCYSLIYGFLNCYLHCCKAARCFFKLYLAPLGDNLMRPCISLGFLDGWTKYMKTD